MPTDSQSRIRVAISDDYAYAFDGIDITIGLKYDESSYSILRIDDGFTRLEPIEIGVRVKPTLTLQHDFARALLDALLRYYQGASDMHTIRSDLLHERGRVDRMIGIIGNIAEGNS